MDVRTKTALIIRKDGMYLQGRILYSNELRWSGSPWDAWSTRIRAKARSVQEKVGGEILLWNPVAGTIREWKYEKAI